MRRMLPLALLLASCGSLEPAGFEDPTDPTPYTPPDPAAPPTGSDSYAPPTAASITPDPAFATGSTSIVADPVTGAVFTVDPDAGTLAATWPSTGASFEVPVGLEPTRVAIAGRQLYVTLRGERAVVLLDASDPAAGVVRRIEVGAEPVGIVARQDGQRVFVAVSQEDSVVELDGATLSVLRRFSIPGEPRYLALHPSGEHLYVGLGRGFAGVRSVDLTDGRVDPVRLLERERQVATTSIDFTMITDVDTRARVTGDLWVTADGGRLLVPTLYTDTITPVAALDSVEEIAPPQNGFEVPTDGYGGGSPIGTTVIERMNPAVAELRLLEDGVPVITGQRTLHVGQAAHTPEGPQRFASYVSSVSASPDGVHYAVTMEASGSVTVLDAREATDPGVVIVGFDDVALVSTNGNNIEQRGFSVVRTTPLLTGAGTNGAVFRNGRLFANARFAGELVEADLAGALAVQAASLTSLDALPAVATWETTAFRRSDDLELGRSLFYGARESVMGGSGVACATCHFEGRNDGVTWTFSDGPRQTPSLAGRVSETTPVTWRSDVSTVQDEADITIQGRLGGEVLSRAELDAIARFIDATPIPDLPDPDPAAVARGADLFAAGGCAACHSGSRFTDGASWNIRGVPVNTPTLTGIAATAPYFHDGSAETLRDVLDVTALGQMGSTATMSDTELDDLEAFLRSL